MTLDEYHSLKRAAAPPVPHEAQHPRKRLVQTGVKRVLTDDGYLDEIPVFEYVESPR